MLFKSADDKISDVESLETLLGHPAATAEQRRKIEQELRFMRSGITGEKEAAYEIDFHYGPSKNWAVIHDLRLEHVGRVAQIDHLLINRFLDIWVCESKRFGEGIAINEHGECAAFFGGKPYGVPSPFEQNRKHCTVLQAVMDADVVKLPTRMGFSIRPNLKSLVLVSKNARITRPKIIVDGLDDIVKADQFRARIDKAFDKDNSILSAAKLIGSDTLEDFAKGLVAQHRPAKFDWPGKYGLPKDHVPTKRPAISAAIQPAPIDLETPATSGNKSKLICASCDQAVPYAVARFCWFNKPRFGGKVYCMNCQKKVPVA